MTKEEIDNKSQKREESREKQLEEDDFKGKADRGLMGQPVVVRDSKTHQEPIPGILE